MYLVSEQINKFQNFLFCFRLKIFPPFFLLSFDYKFMRNCWRLCWIVSEAFSCFSTFLWNFKKRNSFRGFFSSLQLLFQMSKWEEMFALAAETNEPCGFTLFLDCTFFHVKSGEKSLSRYNFEWSQGKKQTEIRFIETRKFIVVCCSSRLGLKLKNFPPKLFQSSKNNLLGFVDAFIKSKVGYMLFWG